MFSFKYNKYIDLTCNYCFGHKFLPLCSFAEFSQIKTLLVNLTRGTDYIQREEQGRAVLQYVTLHFKVGGGLQLPVTFR